MQPPSDKAADDAASRLDDDVASRLADNMEALEEMPRVRFMANATLAIGGIIGLALAVPLVGSLIPEAGGGKANWTPLNRKQWQAFQSATQRKPVQIDFTLHIKDGYLKETAPESVWGIRVGYDRFVRARPDLFSAAGKDRLPYPVVNMGFVIFSPICPHLGCRYAWSALSNRFMCPCHGSQYSYDGAHLFGPAPRGLDPLPLREQNGTAEITWIRYETTVPDRIVVSYVS